MAKYFTSPHYRVTMGSGEKVTIDVTNSISSGLRANAGLVNALAPWMKKRGYTRILDFGAGALRHTLPLLKKGFEVVAVEYKEAFDRPNAQKKLATARKYDGFSAIVWPNQFLESRVRYDVAILAYVLQVIPVKTERHLILREIASRFDKHGPRRLYYASRYGEGTALPESSRYNDGWVRGVAVHDRSFYAEWKAGETHEMFEKAGFSKGGSYEGASQPFIYEYKPGLI